MNLKNTVLALLVVLYACSLQAYSQVAKIEPDQPKWGVTLTVTYNPKAEGAMLRGDDDIYVSGWFFFPDHLERFAGKMDRAGDAFKYQLPVRQNAAAVQVRFFTLGDWDQKAAATTMIYRQDGLPARGAYQGRVGPKQYKEMAAQELALYPDNYAVYRDKWFWASNMDKANFAALVKEDMEALSKVSGQPPDLLYSLSYGYLLLKQEEKSREAIKTMARHLPASPFVAQALDDYEYQIFAQQIKGGGPKEIEALKRAVVRQYPESELARDNAELLAADKEFPLATLEVICHKWMQAESDHPTPYLALADAYLNRQQKIDEASSLIENAIDLLLRGKFRLHGDIAASRTQRALPRAYTISAEINLKSQNYARALSSIKAAQALEKTTLPKTYMLEAEIWAKLSNSAAEEAASLEAWRRGAKDVEDRLKALYQKKKGSLDGFADYLNSAPKAGAAASVTLGGSTSKNPPPFIVTTIDDEKFDLASLRGKVVVLNFWFIGCAPCRVEIPGLNQLVSEFKGKDVIFIAFANDSAPELQTFLKEKPFTYRIVADAGKTADAYDVSAYPTHLIIGKDGQIVARLSGGSDHRHEELRPLIERALNAK
jgi:thiol-disulfide isomerase/thioredoxin